MCKGMCGGGCDQKDPRRHIRYGCRANQIRTLPVKKILTMLELSPSQTTCMCLFNAENRRIYFLRNRCFVPASIEGDDTRHFAFAVRKDFIVGRWPQGPDGIMTFFNLHAILLCLNMSITTVYTCVVMLLLLMVFATHRTDLPSLPTALPVSWFCASAKHDVESQDKICVLIRCLSEKRRVTRLTCCS